MKTGAKFYSIGDVIRTNPKGDYWTASLVLSFQDKTEEFSQLCLIGMTDFVVNHKFTYQEFQDHNCQITNYINFNGEEVRSVFIYSAKINADAEIIGQMDTTQFRVNNYSFKIGRGLDGWPSCGKVTKNLGSLAVGKWRSVHDKENLAKESIIAKESHALMLKKLKKRT